MYNIGGGKVFYKLRSTRQFNFVSCNVLHPRRTAPPVVPLVYGTVLSVVVLLSCFLYHALLCKFASAYLPHIRYE